MNFLTLAVTAPDVGGTLVTNFETVITNLLTTVGDILPSVLVLLGASLSVTIGIRFFKKLAKTSVG